MGFVPNTTPTPNWLYNGEMKKMSDTELRVVLIVTRATLGWIEDESTGMRKQEDWITRSQIMEKTGRTGRAISTAIDNCVKNGWIETRDKEGNMLDTPEKRSRKHIFYRLGNMFLNKTKTGEKSSPDEQLVKKVHHPGEKSSPRLVKKVHTTKETLTKETLTNYAPQSGAQEKSTPKSDLSTQEKEIPDLVLNAKKHIRRIGLFARFKGITFDSLDHQRQFIARNLRAARSLNPYTDEKIISTLAWLQQNANFKFTLETVGKYVDEDLENLKSFKLSTITIG